MSRFWKIRIGTLLWGFATSLYFTGSFVTAIPMFSVMVIGNSVIMYYFSK